jgi:hypothetical protein
MRIWRRPNAGERALRRVSGIGYWRRMGRRRRYRLGLSRVWVSVLDYGGQLRHNGRVLVGLTMSVFLAALGTAALVASSEAVAHALRGRLER